MSQEKVEEDKGETQGCPSGEQRMTYPSVWVEVQDEGVSESVSR